MFPATGAAALIVAAAQAKTLGYEKLGINGLWLAMVKAALCNWMVCMGVVMGLTSRSTLGKIAGCWLPIFIFFALGYEHSVVNMFIIPAGMWMGAPVSLRDWWLWNQLPVTLGNLGWRISICGPADALASRRHAYKDRVATPRNGRGIASDGSTRRSRGLTDYLFVFEALPVCLRFARGMSDGRMQDLQHTEL